MQPSACSSCVCVYVVYTHWDSSNNYPHFRHSFVLSLGLSLLESVRIYSGTSLFWTPCPQRGVLV